jgi:hypothetical protein
MKGFLKIVGTNAGCKRLDKKSGEAELVHEYHKRYILNFENEEFFIEILDFIVLDDIIEYSAWLGDKNNEYGRVAFQFKPSNDSISVASN